MGGEREREREREGERGRERGERREVRNCSMNRQNIPRIDTSNLLMLTQHYNSSHDVHLNGQVSSTITSHFRDTYEC